MSTRLFDSKAPAKVLVREHPGMRRVARPLEAVQLERLERIDRRDLVDDEQRAAEARDPRELRQGELGPGDVVQDVAHPGQVERAVRERERRHVALDEADVAAGLEPLAPLLEQLGHELDGDDLADERGESEREGARAGAGVERPLLAGQREEVADACSEVLGTGVRTPPDRGSSLAEARSDGVGMRPLVTVWRTRCERTGGVGTSGGRTGWRRNGA